MTLQSFLKVLRSRWITVCVTAILVALGAVVVTALTTPLYKAETRLFVSTTGGSTLNEAYQGNRFSQERVVSYAELVQGQTLAQRTIDKLGLNMDASALQSRVTADVKPDTVLIDVEVLDESPVRARDIANTLSDEFVILVRELETPEDGSPPDSRVVVEERASIPQSPVVPKTARDIAIGVALGILLGISLAVLRDMLDNSIKDRQTLEEISGAATVGTIPFDKDRRKEPAIAFDNDNSPISEAFRKLRTNLRYLAVDNPPKVIVITSSVPGEGKSTTAINIALALAEADHNVVLVDGDMRRPTLHKYLDLVGPVGFSTVLSGGSTLSESLQKTRFPHLTVLTAGSIPPNPSELIGSQSAHSLINELRGKFDYVIVDSTPLLAVTDAAVMAASADGVLLITRFGHTKREQVAHAVDSLRDVGAAILGTVFTLTPTRGTAYSYTYYNYNSTDRKSDKRAPSDAVQKSPAADSARPTADQTTKPEDMQTAGRRRKPDTLD